MKIRLGEIPRLLFCLLKIGNEIDWEWKNDRRVVFSTKNRKFFVKGRNMEQVDNSSLLQGLEKIFSKLFCLESIPIPVLMDAERDAVVILAFEIEKWPKIDTSA